MFKFSSKTSTCIAFQTSPVHSCSGNKGMLQKSPLRNLLCTILALKYKITSLLPVAQFKIFYTVNRLIPLASSNKTSFLSPNLLMLSHHSVNSVNLSVFQNNLTMTNQQ